MYIKDKYYNSVKFNVVKRDGSINKAFSFRDLLNIIEPLPVASDSPFLMRSVNYTIMSEILNQKNLPYFALMSKKDLFLLVDKCAELRSLRDIQNKLKRNLVDANFSELSIDDFTDICIKLSEEGKPGKLDHKIVFLMFKRNLKTLCHPVSALDLSKFFRFYDTIYQRSSLVYASNINEMRLILQKF